jgi:hypothetical protein
MKLERRHLQKLRDSARDQACVNCGRQDGTTVWAHYFGPRRGAYGGGMGIKGHDVVGAWLCSQCHYQFDSSGRDKAERWLRSEEFLHACALTWIQLIEKEILR